MKDLTEGKEGKLILLFALPMLIGNIFQQLYNTVDSIVVGRFVGKEALGAVGTSFPIIFLLVSLIMGITMGSTIIIAQYYGAKNMDKVKKSIDTAYIFLFVASLIITIAGVIFSRNILIMMNVPDDILPEAEKYLKIIFSGMIGMFGYNSISAILRGLGDSKTPLYFLIISSIINIVLDLLFVLKFNMGVAGVAWATVIAQGISFLIGIYYLNKTHEVLKFNIKSMRFNKEIFRQSLKIGLPTGIQQMLFSLGIMALQSLVNGFGSETVAAYTAAGRIDTFASMPIMNFGTAISTFVGQNLGAGKEERAINGFKATVKMTVIASLIASILIFIFGKWLIVLFSNDSKVIEIGFDYLKIVCSFYTVVGVMCIINGVLRGAGDTIPTMIISIFTLWFVRVLLAYILSNKMQSPNGIWWAIPISWTVGLILTLIYYKTGKWKNKVVTKGRSFNGN
ncbi:MATE family efflux transporter [Haloimpatiens massiliensis]|uniref:MATE family efflux transporter n=1 Tax=Haloimpatiens massiliensis TaxID=1658110 RepID=UPI000C81BAF1|nr:MATE family efflux transporter [Haloimpatiens massiliensis]